MSCGTIRHVFGFPNVTIAQAKQYLGKAEEFLASARDDLTQNRMIAATSSAVHAAINASDVVTGIRSGQRSASEAHSQAMELLKASGADGEALAKDLARLLALKPKAEYDVVFDRTDIVDGIRMAAPSQVAVDLLTGPGRNPSEAAALLDWMADNQAQWRR